MISCDFFKSVFDILMKIKALVQLLYQVEKREKKKYHLKHVGLEEASKYGCLATPALNYLRSECVSPMGLEP